MYEDDNQNLLIQSLTCYLQYFKHYFSMSYEMVEHYLHSNQLNYTNHNINKLTKMTQKNSHPKFQISPFLLLIKQTNKSYVDRFHMRITQYLQYRLNNVFKSYEKQHKIIVILNGFVNCLHKIFKNIIFLSKNHKQNKQSYQSIGTIFIQIQLCVKNFFLALYKYFQRLKSKDQLALQQINISKNAIQSSVMNPFYQYLKEFQVQQTLKQNEIKNLQVCHNIRTHNRSKSFFDTESLHSLKSKSMRQSMQNRQIYLNNNQIGKKNCLKEEYLGNLKQYQKYKQDCQQKNKFKSSYIQMLSIMQIQAVQVYSRDYIMNQLKVKNMKNKVMIGKFLKVYKKKQKKHKKRQKILAQKHCFTQNIQNIQQNLIKKQKKFSLIKLDKQTQQQERRLQQIDKNKQLQKTIEQKQNPYSLNQKIIAICVTNKQQSKRTNNLQQSLNIDNNKSKSLIKKHMPKPQSDTFKHLTQINPITSNQSQLQSTKDAFLYKEKEKLYFQQLKYKMNLQSQKMSPLSPLQLKKDCLQLQALKKLNKIPENKFLSQQLGQKKSQRNIIKRTTIKGSNFSSFIIIDNEKNKNNYRSCHSNSELLNKNYLVFQNSKNNLQTLSSLQVSSLQKLIPNRRLVKDVQQNLEVQNGHNNLQSSTKMQQKVKRKIQIQGAVMVLPRITRFPSKNDNNLAQKLFQTDKK